MFRLIINGTPATWTKETRQELNKLIRIYNYQDRLAGRVVGTYSIIEEDGEVDATACE